MSSNHEGYIFIITFRSGSSQVTDKGVNEVFQCPKFRFAIRIIVFDKLESQFVSQGLTLSTASLVFTLLSDRENI